MLTAVAHTCQLMSVSYCCKDTVMFIPSGINTSYNSLGDVCGLLGTMLCVLLASCATE